MTSVQIAYCSLGKKLSRLCHFWTLSVTKNKWNVNRRGIYKKKEKNTWSPASLNILSYWKSVKGRN